MNDTHLPRRVVLDVASRLTLEDGAFLIGGQALNLWAEYYSTAPELKLYGPYTSKDIDYFGQREAALKLAEQLDGHLRIPDIADSTPETAQVVAVVDGAEIRIDFLGHVLGVRRDVERHVAEIVVPAERDDGTELEVAIPLMHPLDCLQSRISNLKQLGRDDDVTHRQAAAAPFVLREYLDEALAEGDAKEVSRTLKALFRYLRYDLVGRHAHEILERDPVWLIEHFAADARLDPRYREHQLGGMIATLGKRR